MIRIGWGTKKREDRDPMAGNERGGPKPVQLRVRNDAICGQTQSTSTIMTRGPQTYSGNFPIWKSTLLKSYGPKFCFTNHNHPTLLLITIKN